jgi:hypothetical protein
MTANASADDGRQTGFPQSPSAFDEDERISWSRVDNKYLLETDEGNEYEWDDALRRWVPVVGFLSRPSLDPNCVPYVPTPVPC